MLFSFQSPTEDCLDPCCSTSSTCLNGARCQASCMKNNKRFQCLHCTPGYGGERCELPRTCAAYVKYPPGLQVIYTTDNSPFTVFCHFDSLLQIAMTLVMSVARKHSNTYRPHSLQNDFPRDENFHNWEDYRLSLTRMEGIRDYGSTHWIYTCSYHTRGLSNIDYLRSKFSETDILTYQYTQESFCTNTMEYINIQGTSCQECATSIGQGSEIFNVNCVDVNCGDLDGLPQVACSSVNPAKLFGSYSCYWTAFSCSITDSDTTQLWFGQHVDVIE